VDEGSVIGEWETRVRVLVCGSRDWTSASTIRGRLKKLPKDVTIIEGGARGADSVAREVARNLGLDVITVWANWEKYGKKAGPIRNGRMLDMLDPNEDMVIAFHPDLSFSRGTVDTVTRAEKRGIKVEVIK